jgi:hypothetical protein
MLLLQYYIRRAVARIKIDHDIFFDAGWNITTDIIGPDRQFTVPAIYQYRQLNTAWPAMIHHSVHGSTDSAPGEKHVIHQDNFLSLD